MKTLFSRLAVAAAAFGCLMVCSPLPAADKAKGENGPAKAPDAREADKPDGEEPDKKAEKSAPENKADEKKADEKKADEKTADEKDGKRKKESEKKEEKPKLPPIPKWEPPLAAEVRDRALAWLDERQVDEATRREVEKIWELGDGPSGPALLVAVTATFAMGDQRARKLVEVCSRPRIELVPPSYPWLLDPKTDPFMAANLRLLYGRWLAHELLYDEAKELLGGLEPGDVVDPASLLFYQAVTYHFFLDQENGLRTIDGLLKSPEHCPRRYVVLGSLMREDLSMLKEDTLDHIARRMRDIERRLDLGRAGRRVRQVEDGVIESLDKLIKKLEQQQQGGGGGGGAGGNNIRSSSPAPDSRIIGGKGPGQVTKRDIGSKSGWGSLPPKEREEALQQIGRDLPSHYRDKVEQYFRKLAADKDSEP